MKRDWGLFSRRLQQPAVLEGPETSGPWEHQGVRGFEVLGPGLWGAGLKELDLHRA